MTKYILLGGADLSASGSQKASLAEEIKDSLDEQPKILSVPFALPRENWEQYYPTRKEYFGQLFSGNHESKMAQPQQFEEQIKWANTIWLHGGDETLLSYWLDKYDLKSLFSKKVVVGSSAGAEYLSATFNTPDWREIKKGRGFIDANVITHYGSDYGLDDPRGPVDWVNMKSELEKFDSSIKTYCLSEGDFAVFEK